MAKIPLRAYVKEIENLIDRGEIEQAVAHAKNILKSYPKHINTYRLLGKAFLESQRYSEAADILQRVLSVIPDDFVSQIGMSIIREDEGNLDAAIWHMERAYEVQPFNPAVQDELRRLYGRRDGVEPPKIRLTRSALVRMYARGELYPQAIAETRAALAEDPQRMDLSVLLARLYSLSGHKNDAAEVCSELINKLPYCYEANRLLAEILPSVNREEEAKKFQQRIYALDPYEAFVSPNAPTADQVPDQAITVEQFSWESSMEDAQVPEWTRTVGVEWQETEEEALPDWLNTLKPEGTRSGQGTAAQTEVQPANESEAGAVEASTTEGEPAAQDDLIPDWMKDKGWTTSNRSADEVAAEQAQVDANQPEELSPEEISPAEIPDWLQSIAPPEAANSGEDGERTDWLESILVSPGGANGKETTEAEPPTGTDESAEAAVTNDLPDWLSSLEPGAGESINAAEGIPPAAETEPAEELPDWFNQTQGEGENSPASANLEELPDWSKIGQSSIDSQQTFEDETPDWLKSLGGESNEQTTPESDQPDWLQELKPRTSGLSPEDLSNPGEQPAAEMPAEATPDWLKDLGTSEAVQSTAPSIEGFAGGIEEDTISHQAEDLQPESKQGDSLPSVQAAAPEPGMPDLSDMDATMAWLESLAAKQGADEATLITPADQRTDTPPDWVIEQSTIADQLPSEEPGILETPTEPDKAVSFVEAPTAENEQPSEPTPLPEQPEGKPLDWYSELPVEEAAPHAAEDVLAAPTEATAANLSDEDAAMAWLESLAAKQGADEATLVTKPEDRLETPPDWVKNEIETAQPDQIEHKQSLPSEENTAELPDWLQSIETPEQAAVEQPTADEPQVTDEFIKAETQPAEPTVGEIGAPGGNQNDESSVEPTQPIKVSAKPAEAPMPDMADMDATMAWLESLAAKQGADEATLITPPEQRTEQIPEWLTKEMDTQEESTLAVEGFEPGPVETSVETPQAQVSEAVTAQEYETQAVEETIPDGIGEVTQAEEKAAFETPTGESLPTAEEVAATPAPTTETQGSSTGEMDLDSAFAWLESLAAKQGADEATLINAPEDREESAPDWVKHEQAQAIDDSSLLSQSQTQDRSDLEESKIEQAVPTEAAFPSPEIGSEQQVEDAPDWLKELHQEEQTPSQVEDFEAETQFAPGEFEPWAADLKPQNEAAVPSQPEAAQANIEEVPDWLRQLETEEQSTTAPTSEESIPDWLKGMEEEGETQAVESEKAAASDDFRSAWEPEMDTHQTSGEIQPMEQSREPAADLAGLQESLRQGDLDGALSGYTQFINDGRHLDETIHDLRDALYRYPVDINLWQTLGDAYSRNDQLQEALDAYTKAEELLR